MTDLRRHPRIETIIDTIYYNYDEGNLEDGRMYYPGKIVNISKGGVGMIANYPHDIEDQIWLEGLPGISSPCKSSIRWTKIDGDCFHVGVRFDQVSN
ncbi:MAG: PilZ domain-containing protein [Gammaproteobacteria bacterium]